MDDILKILLAMNCLFLKNLILLVQTVTQGSSIQENELKSLVDQLKIWK